MVVKKMGIILDEPNLVKDNIFYIIVSQHIVPNEYKSHWSITNEEQLKCFEKSLINNWLSDFRGWGLHIINNQINPLGYSKQGEQLKIAKFVDSYKSSKWHGYPADYRNNIQDRPSSDILRSWVNNNIIQKHQMSKIRSGKKCAL
jgi:hypothetical protein